MTGGHNPQFEHIHAVHVKRELLRFNSFLFDRLRFPQQIAITSNFENRLPKIASLTSVIKGNGPLENGGFLV
jgi:hypothetical protein